MRSDLAKCTTEAERRGGRGKKTHYGGKVRINQNPDHDYLDEYGGFRSSARRRHWDHSEFSDVLNPLRGNLRVNLGRRWDDVFSEFCQVLDRRGLSGYHIWTHLKQEVETNTFIENGKVYRKVTRRQYHQEMEVEGFYVHPVTGILEYQQQDRYWNRKRGDLPKEVRVPGNEEWVYREIDGLWFRVLIGWTVTNKRQSRWDGGVRIIPEWEEMIVVRRSANKKEIAWLKCQLALSQNS
jgi:hypothetical protein